MDRAKESGIKGTASWFVGAIKRAISFDITFTESPKSGSENQPELQASEENLPDIIVDAEIVLEMPRKPAKIKGKRQIARLRQEISNRNAEIALLELATQQQDEQCQLNAERKELEKRLLEQLKADFSKLKPKFDGLQMFLDGVWNAELQKLESKYMKILWQEYHDIELLLIENFHNATEIAGRIKKLDEDINDLKILADETMKPPKPKEIPPKLPDKPGQLDGIDMEVWETALKQLKMILEQPKRKKTTKVTCDQCGRVHACEFPEEHAAAHDKESQQKHSCH